MEAEQAPLIVNVFGLQLEPRQIYRHVIHIKLVDGKNNKDYILTTLSARGRGNRVSKLNDNFLIVERLLDKFVEEKNAATKGERGPEKPIFAYDGAQTLFSVEPVSVMKSLTQEEALSIDGISEFLKDSLKFLNGSIEAFCEVDVDKPFFDQTNTAEWEDPRFNGYLDIVTSQYAVRKGTYLSYSKGLHVHTKFQDALKVGWAYGAKGIHKGCRVVGAEHPLPILELDPQSTQYYAPIPLDQMLLKAFPRDFSTDPNNFRTPDMRVMRNAKLLIRDLKCNPFYQDIQAWATNTLVIHDLDYNAQRNPEYQKQYPDLRFPHLPAAICGAHKKRYPLERLKALPYQSIDRRVLDAFDLIPKANTPQDRWSDMKNHFKEFEFNNQVMAAFGVEVCNDPFENVSAINGERVAAPDIRYTQKVRVDDDKRDWRAREFPFHSASSIDFLIVVLISAQTRNFREEQAATQFFVEHYLKRCKEKGMKITNVDMRCLNTGNDADKFLTCVFRDMLNPPKGWTSSTYSPFVLLISDDVPDIHECLKFEERMSDIPTQHILIKNVRKMRDQIKRQLDQRRQPYDLTLDNIVMKTNIKAGGINYTSDVPHELGAWREVPTFVIGMDVAHPDKYSIREGAPSTVGLSCNSAESPYSFIGDFAYTTARKEAIDDEILRSFVAKNVRRFADARGFPRKVIIFRDGVSVGEEVEAVREASIIEETIINEAAEAGFRNYKLCVLSIVVKKRHHTRFYARGNAYGGQGSQPVNPLPDTAVGGMIAEYGKRQIFIQAFRPVQGTAKVPSFLVTRDDDEMTDEHVSKLVCAVCSLHQIVNSPTSIPTPVFVAHELAKRGTDLFKAFRLKNGTFDADGTANSWRMLTMQLSYSQLERLSKIRVV